MPYSIPPRDPLTGAFTRASLQQRLKDLSQRSEGDGTTFALLIIDIDHFKSINDAFGHLRGDRVLAEFVSRVQGLLRPADALFRYGGDEFVVLLPDADGAVAASFGLHLLDIMREEPFPGNPPLRCTLSIGAATYPADSLDADALFACADQRVMDAKRLGRARLVYHDTPTVGEPVWGSDFRLVERDEPLQALWLFLDALMDETQGMVTIRGPLGSGRSRLLQELQHTAQLRGCATLLLQGRPGLQARLYGVFDEAALHVFGLPSPAAGSVPFIQAVRRLLVSSEHGALLILADDIAEFDFASIELIQELLAAPMPVAIGLVCTGVNGSRTPIQETNVAQSQVEIGPLSLAGVSVWLRSLLRWEVPEPICRWLHHETGGLPAQIRRAVDLLSAQGVLRSTGSNWDMSPTFAVFPLAARLARRPKHRLPQLPLEFVGRNNDIRELKRRIAGSRLVTIAGPGGIGKTRLALQVAVELASSFDDGACFVPLTTVSQPHMLESALAEALQIPKLSRDNGLPMVMEYLRNQEVLLVLDNADHLSESISDLETILERAPRVRLLVTARERLRLPGELVFDLRGLAVPPPEDTAMERYSAVQLFTRHARRVLPGFSVSHDDRQHVSAICRLAAGMPLAIELAAGWVALFSCAEVAAAIGHNLAFHDPPDGSAAAPLGAVFGYFWGQLSPDEARIARRLAVFRGSFSRAAAGAVAGASPFFLAALLDKAFLSRLPDGRYVLHDLLRQYAGERLAAQRGELVEAFALHAAFYADLVETAEPQLQSVDQGVWLARLEAEHNNLRAALEWSRTAPGHSATAVRLAAALWPFWVYRSHVREGRDWLTQLLPLAAAAPAHQQANLLNGAGFLAFRQGDLACGQELLEQSLALFTELGDGHGIAWALNHLGYVAQARGDLDAAAALQERSLVAAQQIGHHWHSAWAFSAMGDVAYRQGDDDRANALLTQSLVLFEQLGDQHGVGSALQGLGRVALRRGDLEQAQVLCRQSHTTFLTLGDNDGAAIALEWLALIGRQRGQVAVCESLYRESLRLRWDLGDKVGISRCLIGLARTAVARGFVLHAAWLCGAATAFAQPGSEPEGAADAWDELVVRRGGVNSDALAAAWAAGRAADSEAAVLRALALGASGRG